MNGPTLAGFMNFIRNVMGITTDALPDDSIYPAFALSVALSIVNPALQCVPSGPTVPGVPAANIYNLAVYNLAGSGLINYAQDVPPSTFFADQRESYDSLGFIPGVIQSSADESTSDSFVVQEAAKNFTLLNLQQLKDPFGRQYLALVQGFGTIVGIS